jgi:hypothetical protein
MAKSVRDLVASVMDPGNGAPPTAETFPSLDMDQILRDLRLEERAERVEGPDTAELDILDYIERLARKAHEIYLARVDDYETRIRRTLAAVDLPVQIEAIGSTALAEVRAQIVNHQNQLNLLLQAVRRGEDEFRHFRQRHGLTRPPKYISLDERRLLLLILLALVLLESLLTGTLFAQARQGNLAASLVQALLLSILNVGLSALYGMYGYPYLFHRKLVLRLVGVAATLLFAIGLLRLNLAIGHVWDLSPAETGRPPSSDPRTLILVLLGIVVGLAAAVHVATRRDPYPGYTGVALARQRVIHRYAQESSRGLAQILELRNWTVEDMSGAVRLIGEAERSLMLALEGRSGAHQEYVIYLQQLAEVHQRLVQRYRELSPRVRNGQPAVDFQAPALRPMFAEPPSQAGVRLEEDVRREVIARLEYYIKAVNDEVDRAMPVFLRVGELGAIERVSA